MEQDEALISQRVQALLDEHSMSGSELARRLGTSQSYVSRRIRGDVPWRATDLNRIAGLVGVPVVTLIDPSSQAAA